MSKKSIRKNYLMIQGWMSEDLNLKGNELLAYALIYGFCQDEESEFTGSIKYIMRWLNCSKPTVLKAVDNLVKKGLVIKKQEQKNNVTFNHFTVNFNVVNKYFTPSKETLPLVKKLNEGSKETLQGGSKETLPNNIYNNKDNNNIYSDLSFWDSTDFVDSYKGFKQMRKLIKSPLTERAEKMILNKINKISNGDVNKAVAILDQSTQNSWKDVYELKSNQQVVNNQKQKSFTPTEKRNFTY